MASSVQHNVHLGNDGPIESRLDDKALCVFGEPLSQAPPPAAPNMVTSGFQKSQDGAGQNAKLKASKQQFTNRWAMSRCVAT